MDLTDYRSSIPDSISCQWVVFFATFGRFEYALKRSGFLKRPRTTSGAQCPHHSGVTSEAEALERKDYRAEADWEAFAKALPPELWRTIEGCPKCELLFSKPAHQQMASHREGATSLSLYWRPKAKPKCNQDLFGEVSRIRNNLFHGEKIITDARDADLVAAAQIVLDHAWDTAQSNRLENPQLKTFCKEFRFSL